MPYEINRTELVWPGKYDENGKRSEIDPVSLPFQVIERVNESRATREASKAHGLTLFDFWEGDTAETFETGWRNKLIWGDNKLIMSSLLDQFSGKIDLAYIDPPFATGADFSLTVSIGDSGEQVYKEQSLIEEKAYRDTWGAGLESYLAMMSDRLYLIRDLMSPEGSIFVHCDWHVGHYLRAILDETFGQGQFMNELVWYYYNKFQGNVNRFASDHDVIFWYRKGEKYKFKALKEKRLEGKVQQLKRAWDKEKGAIVNVKGPDGKVLYQETDERTVDDVWRLSMLQPADRTENLGYPTQKPESVLQRIIEACSEPGDLIADFFAGSGTTPAVAEKLGRRWIAADLGRFAVHITRKRLLNIPGCKPFEVLNLGKYERKYWQVATFGEDLDDDGVISLYEYVAFILKLYVASPAAGMQHLQGRKGRAFVHVGAVDSPVTIGEIAACIEECVALKARELHILGWEWEMGLHDPMADEAAARGVRLVLRQIPREVMEQQAGVSGDVKFFELAYLDVEVSATRRKHEVVVKLKNFIIPNPELVPEDVREKIRRWSDYVDYWAVDWNFSEDTFHQGWVSYRTRKDRTLELDSDAHVYDSPGEYAVMVKVIDIFGNDTSKICHVEVS